MATAMANQVRGYGYVAFESLDSAFSYTAGMAESRFPDLVIASNDRYPSALVISEIFETWTDSGFSIGVTSLTLSNGDNISVELVPMIKSDAVDQLFHEATRYYSEDALDAARCGLPCHFVLVRFDGDMGLLSEYVEATSNEQ